MVLLLCCFVVVCHVTLEHKSYVVRYWRALADASFQQAVSTRWRALRSDKWSDANMLRVIGGFSAELNESAYRQAKGRNKSHEIFVTRSLFQAKRLWLGGGCDQFVSVGGGSNAVDRHGHRRSAPRGRLRARQLLRRLLRHGHLRGRQLLSESVNHEKRETSCLCLFSIFTLF